MIGKENSIIFALEYFMISRFCVVHNENAKWDLGEEKRGVVLLLPIRIVGVVGGQTPPHIAPWLTP